MLDKLKAISCAGSVFELRDVTVNAFGALGLTRAYFLAPIGVDRSVGRALTNMGFSREWEAAYNAGKRLDDPLPDIAVRVGRAFFWNELPQDTVLNKAESDYLQSLDGWGMPEGICAVAYGPAARVGFVGAAPSATFDRASLPDKDMFRIAAETSFLRYCELNVLELGFEMNLSSRELDVLHWMAQGKSNAAIGEILGLSQDTVGTYIKRIFAKLDVFDRTSAVMKGVTRGLVIATDPQIERAIEERRKADKAR